MADMEDKECCLGLSKLVLGGLIGAGVALLLAPQSGKKTRKDLACFAEEFGPKANKAVKEFSEMLSDFIETAGDRATEILEQGADMTQESKKALLAALEQGQEKLQAKRSFLSKIIG